MPTVNTYAMQRLISNLSPDELLQWEDDDGYAIPPPNQRDANDGIDNVQGAPRSATAYDRYNDAVRRNAEHEKMAPRVSEFKPNKWQRLAAAGANFAAGYVNAGGRTRVDPAAMQAINGSLLRPGYDKAKQQWDDQGRSLQIDERVAGAEAKTESEQARRKTDFERAEAYKKAQASAAALNESRKKKLEAPPGRFEKTPIGMFDNETKAYVPPPPKDPGKVAETPTAGMARRTEEVKTMTTLTPEQKETYILTGKVPAPPKPKGAGKGREEPKVTPVQRLSVSQDKTKELRRLENEFEKEIEKLQSEYPGDGPDMHEPRVAWMAKKDAIVRRHESNKKSVMDLYDEGVRTLGGSISPRAPKAPDAPIPPGAKTATNKQTGQKMWFNETTNQWAPL